jgi:starvation-inducible DNA-binding protein
MPKTSGTPARQPADGMSTSAAKYRRTARLLTPTNLGREAGDEIGAALTKLLADFFALYIKTKNFHWHVSGPHFRDYHLLLDEQASQIFEATDLIAERARKLGGTTIRSIRHVARLQRLSDNDAEFIAPLDMLAELRDDNSRLTCFMREAHRRCDQLDDTATASLLENWIDEAEHRVWFLFEASRVNGRSP